MLSSVNNSDGLALPHDHLDDLESFFYLFCWICLAFDGPDQLSPRRCSDLIRWEHPDPIFAGGIKTTMMLHFRQKVTSYFGPVFQKLLLALRGFLWPHIYLKIKQRDDRTIPRKHLLDLAEPAKADYAAMLGLIDQAIVDLDLEILNPQPITPTPVAPTRTAQPLVLWGPPSLAHSHSSSSLKRQAENPGIIDDSPKSKKQKQREYENNWDDSHVFDRPSNAVDYSRVLHQF